MMRMNKKVVGGSAAGVIAVAVAFTPIWEGMDLVAKRDPVGTGNPVTYCIGQTDEFGKVKVGTRFTPEQCKVLFAKSIKTYWAKIEPCIKVDLPVKTAASLLDAAYNAGPAAVCRSPMLARMNAGHIEEGCKAFDGWYVTTKIRGQRRVLRGLVNRRSGDSRKGEKELCLEGLADIPKKHWWQ